MTFYSSWLIVEDSTKTMLLYFFIFGLIANLSAACLDCPLEDGERGKLSFTTIPDEESLKVIALAGRGLPGVLGSHQQQQKGRLFYQKSMDQRISPFFSSTGSAPLIPSQQQQLPNNLLQVYTLLNRGSAVDPRLLVDDYYLPDAASAPLFTRLSKKAEKGMSKKANI